MLPPEEAARAGIYALLGRLFSAPPDPALLEAIAGAEDVFAEDAAIVGPWVELAVAAALTDAESVNDEYRAVFAVRRSSWAAAHRLARLCETLGGAISLEEASLVEQQRFFTKKLMPAASALCAALRESPSGGFYRYAGLFAAAFFNVERTAFELPFTH
ncbi:MAG: hypothetical protein ACT4P4_26615 [Betaproteobacteria bacterium]